jgi:hypothetical protein
MSYEKLPMEVRMMIFAQLHNIYQENARVIQKYWHKCAEKVAMKLWLNFELDNPRAWGEGTFNEEPYLILPETAKLLKFTSKVISGKGDYKTISDWRHVLYQLDRSLWNEEYTGGQHHTAIYNEIQKHVHIIAPKFNITIDEDGRLVF